MSTLAAPATAEALSPYSVRREIVASVSQGWALLLIILAALGLLWWLGRPQYPTGSYWQVLGLISAGLLSATLLYRLEMPTFWRSLLLLALSITANVLPLVYLRQPEFAWFLALPLVLAVATLPAWASVPAAITCLAVVHWALPSTWMGPGVMIALAVAAAGLVVRPVSGVLSWAWTHYAGAVALVGDAQEQRGTLNRTLKALDLTNRLLQRTNGDLILARREAEEARQLKEEFCTSISHELRTPLNIILGFAEIMHASREVYGEVDWPVALRRDVAEIYRNAGYISTLVDDILDLARVEAMRLPVRRERSDLAVVVDESVSIARQLLGTKPVELSVELPPNLPQLPMDSTRIRQVLLNLLGNASRHTDRGYIRISAEVTSDDVVVTVADSGAGIPPEALRTIFDEYSQVQAGGSGSSLGKGLGLSIAKRFVQLHGGRLWADSEVGVGSQFHFSLPLIAKEFSRILPAAQRANDVQREDALLLVGGRPAHEWLERHLEGIKVVIAAPDVDLAEAAQAAEAQAVVVDIASNGPATDGQALPQGLPVLRCAFPQPPLPEHFDQALAKPVTGDSLLKVLQEIPADSRVLVVDDDRGFVQFVVRLLQARSPELQVEWSYGAEAALAKMRAQPPTLALVDLMMGTSSGSNGSDLAQAVRADPALVQVRLVAVSGALTAGRDAWGHELCVSRGDGLTEDTVLAVLQGMLAPLRELTGLPADDESAQTEAPPPAALVTPVC